MLRWGLLGDGDQAASVASGVRAAGGDLAVVATRTLTAAQSFASGQGVRRARNSYEDVVEAADVDAVFVDLPASDREQWIGAALAAGKHVLCAPPLAADAETAGRLAAAAVAARRLLSEALPMRFHPRTSALLDVVRGGEIGAVRLCQASVATAASGDCFAVAHPAVACVRWLVGEQPHAVRAVSEDGALGIVLSFAGAVAALAAVTGATGSDALHIVGTDATVVVASAFGATRAHDAVIERNGEIVGSWRADPVERMVTAFSDAAAGGPVLLPPEDAVATAAVLDAVRAAATG